MQFYFPSYVSEFYTNLHNFFSHSSSQTIGLVWLELELLMHDPQSSNSTATFAGYFYNFGKQMGTSWSTVKMQTTKEMSLLPTLTV